MPQCQVANFLNFLQDSPVQAPKTAVDELCKGATAATSITGQRAEIAWSVHELKPTRNEHGWT